MDDEEKKQVEFVTAVGGYTRADRLLYISNNSYPHGTKYDKLFRKSSYMSKQDVFRSKAKREGFTDKQINMFLNL